MPLRAKVKRGDELHTHSSAEICDQERNFRLKAAIASEAEAQQKTGKLSLTHSLTLPPSLCVYSVKPLSRLLSKPDVAALRSQPRRHENETVAEQTKGRTENSPRLFKKGPPGLFILGKMRAV